MSSLIIGGTKTKQFREDAFVHIHDTGFKILGSPVTFNFLDGYVVQAGKQRRRNGRDPEDWFDDEAVKNVDYQVKQIKMNMEVFPMRGIIMDPGSEFQVCRGSDLYKYCCGELDDLITYRVAGSEYKIHLTGFLDIPKMDNEFLSLLTSFHPRTLFVLDRFLQSTRAPLAKLIELQNYLDAVIVFAKIETLFNDVFFLACISSSNQTVWASDIFDRYEIMMNTTLTIDSLVGLDQSLQLLEDRKKMARSRGHKSLILLMSREIKMKNERTKNLSFLFVNCWTLMMVRWIIYNVFPSPGAAELRLNEFFSSFSLWLLGVADTSMIDIIFLVIVGVYYVVYNKFHSRDNLLEPHMESTLSGIFSSDKYGICLVYFFCSMISSIHMINEGQGVVMSLSLLKLEIMQNLSLTCVFFMHSSLDKSKWFLHMFFLGLTIMISLAKDVRFKCDGVRILPYLLTQSFVAATFITLDFRDKRIPLTNYFKNLKFCAELSLLSNTLLVNISNPPLRESDVMNLPMNILNVNMSGVLLLIIALYHMLTL